MREVFAAGAGGGDRLHGELKEFRAEVRAELRAVRDALAMAQTVGYPRCAQNNTRLEHAEADIELCHDRVSELKKWRLGALVAGAVWALEKVWGALQSKINH